MIEKQPERVEMRPAYEWTCENCGRNSFESAIVCELTPDDRLEQAKFMGLVDEFEEKIPEEMQGEFLSYPDSVTCPHCKSEFPTKHMAED